jgi:hypothetical protein
MAPKMGNRVMNSGWLLVTASREVWAMSAAELQACVQRTEGAIVRLIITASSVAWMAVTVTVMAGPSLALALSGAAPGSADSK